jgi:pimeloyl-ACP methyl ester carboxylesterase
MRCGTPNAIPTPTNEFAEEHPMHASTCAQADLTPADTTRLATLPPGEIVSWAHGEIPLFVQRPDGKVRGVFVTVHGNNRQAAIHALRFSALARRHGLLLIAPSFTRAEHPYYQRLADGVDDALTRTVLALLHAEGIHDDAWLWFGHSAGAQFVHRYTLRHPARVRRAALSAAGWYTLPDAGLAYPYGIDGFAGMAPLPEVLAVRQRVFVGALDVHGGDSLRREPVLDERQGSDRLARARTFVREMRRLAIANAMPARVSLREMPDAGHDFDINMRRTRLGPQVLRFLLRDADDDAAPCPAQP